MSLSAETGDIKNYMEDCVDDMLQLMLKNEEFANQSCTCDQCRMDAKAIALNALPQKYVVTRKGELYAKLSSLQNQFEVDIMSALTKARGIVAKNPRHK